MYEYRAIIYRLREGMSVRQISKSGLAGRPKVTEILQLATRHGWLEVDATLPDDQAIASLLKTKPVTKNLSKVTAYRDYIEQAVKDGVSAKVIHQRLKEQHHFQGAYNCVQRFAQKIKQAQGPEMTVPLTFNIGEAAQVDFGQGPTLWDEREGKEVKTWFFVMTLCWSRHQYVELVTHQNIETWLRCHENAFTWFGGVVKKIIIDNAKCAITKACYFEPKVQRSYEEFAQAYGFIISACPPGEPKKKGRVESGIKYVKHNFTPLRTLTSVQDANIQLKKWILDTAGIREHGSTFTAPLNAFETVEKETLKPLPNPLPEISVWTTLNLYRDCHVRYEYCHYSAPFDLFGEPLWLKATPALIEIYHEHRLVAIHARLYKKGSKSTKQEHLPVNARYYLKRTPQWCLEQSERIGENCALLIDELLNHKTKDLLRQAQSILSLADTYGHAALEQACVQAINLSIFDYRTLKSMLERGIEETCPIQAAPEMLERDIYQGSAKFQRLSSDFIH